MVRVREYIEKDVLTAAKERLHHIFDLYDSVVVCFSGGKDSLTALELTWEVAQERGLDHVDAIFRDEELIPDSVIDFVKSYMDKPWCRLKWYAIPLASTKFILGRTFDYVQWDPAREHVRTVPPWAITLPAGDTRVFDQYTTDAFIAQSYPGKVAFVTGIRAAESLMRFRASVNKLNENYINACSDPRVSLCKPLYDWEEDDILRYFYERRVAFCQTYTAQHLAGMQLRVSTPLHAEHAKHIGKLRESEPEFYNRVLKVFPEMAAQERYYSSLDRKGLLARYGTSMEGVRAYVEEHYTDEAQLQKATKMLKHIIIRRDKNPASYPVDHVLKYFMAGSFKRELLPKGNR